LTTSQKRVLLEWLQLLSVSLPPEWKLHELIRDLEDNIDYISTNLRNLYQILLKHERPRDGFSKSCRRTGSKSAINGFQCGFWKLLHLTTVGVAEHRGGLNLLEAGVNVQSFSPAFAAETIRNYISVFYNTCNKCRDNFVKLYDHCENNRRCGLNTDEETATGSDWSDLAKWLWEMHNEISIIQLKDSKIKSKNANKGSIEPIDQMKVIYPNLDSCVQCFNSDGTWNDDAVFLYLEKIYWYDMELGEPKINRLLFSRHNEGGYDQISGIFRSWIYVFSIVGLIAIIARHPRNNLYIRKIIAGGGGSYKSYAKRSA